MHVYLFLTAVSGENNNRGSEYFYVRQPRRIFTFREILAHWGSAHSTHAALTELLKVLHELQITLGPKDYCGRNWPLTGHTLLQVCILLPYTNVLNDYLYNIIELILSDTCI